MRESPTVIPPTVIPSMRYENASAAIDWLCTAFGFARNMVVDGPGGTIAHAQLSYGNGMIMLGSNGKDEYRIESPRQLAGAVTGGVYVVVADVDAHCARARAAGATILREPVDQEYGGRDYSCRDLKGHLWHFGTYAPTID
jgi:uncharacterized glyoxalase superfamily protein PhnB